MGSNNKGLSGAQVRKIKTLNSMGYNDANISELMDVTWRRVSYWRKKMDLPQRTPYTQMSTEKKRETMRATLRRETGEKMNYRNMAHERRAVRLGWPGYKLGQALILKVLAKGGEMRLQDILKSINLIKASKGWRPETTERMLIYYMAGLREEGLVDRVYPRGHNWRGARIYFPTERVLERERANKLEKVHIDCGNRFRL